MHASAHDGLSCSRLAGLQESAPRDWEPGWGRWEEGPRERAVVGAPEVGLGRRLGMEEGGCGLGPKLGSHVCCVLPGYPDLCGQ